MLKQILRNYMKQVDTNWNYITSPEMKKLISKNPNKYFLLDIRKQNDFKKAHIPNSINIYWKTILSQKNLNKLPKDKIIILICYVGHTASQVLVMLRLLGYKVITLKFGMGISPVQGIPVAGWTNYGFSTESLALQNS